MSTLTLSEKAIQRKWLVVDAKDIVLGRLASRVAYILKGKHKPVYDPAHDMGDNVIVINANFAKLTGDKFTAKTYFRHSTYMGGGKEITYQHLLAKDPEKPIRKAVWGMLPKNTLGRRMLLKLHVYGGAEHPHVAQKPESIDITKV
jgi:large subunit ribosomal protein L13